MNYFIVKVLQLGLTWYFSNEVETHLGSVMSLKELCLKKFETF